jgi:hypothetical protein
MRVHTSACALLAGDSATTQETQHGERWYTPKQAAKHYKIGFSTLAKLRLSGDGPPYVKIGVKVLYSGPEFDAWLASKLRTSTSQSAEDRA